MNGGMNMYINKKLFDECFCPCDGIGRVKLRGDKEIPKGLVKVAKEIDGDSYSSSCFYIDIFKGKALICYVTEDGYEELCDCDNYEEVLEKD